MSLLGFGVKNLRCLTDTGIVPIKPITLLVGRNSSGKSTFLRTFPLLRQSVETARESSILWYDPALVDFGSFADAVNYRADEASITFRFRLRAQYHGDLGAVAGSIFDVAMTLSQGPEGPYVASYELLVEDHTVVMKFAPGRELIEYKIDSYDVLTEAAPLALGGRVVLFPALQRADKARTAYIPAARQTRNDTDEYVYEGEIEVFLQLVDAAAHTALGDATAADTLADSLLVGSFASMLAEVEHRLDAHGFHIPSAAPGLDAPSLRRVLALHVACSIPIALDDLDHYVADFTSGITYVAPLRASAQRAYRIQDISVDEVSPQFKFRSLIAWTGRTRA